MMDSIVNKFQPGRIVATPGALEALTGTDEGSLFLSRHLAGDFGKMDPEDIQTNLNSIKNRGMIMSSYTTLRGETIWIITDPGHETTTFLLPEEY